MQVRQQFAADEKARNLQDEVKFGSSFILCQNILSNNSFVKV